MKMFVVTACLPCTKKKKRAIQPCQNNIAGSKEVCSADQKDLSSVSVVWPYRNGQQPYKQRHWMIIFLSITEARCQILWATRLIQYSKSCVPLWIPRPNYQLM